MEEMKRTKTEKYAAIREILVGANADADLIELCDAETASIAAKKEKAQARAAEKKAVGDELRATVLDHVTADFQTADEIFASIEGVEDLTRGKVVNRLSALATVGAIEKADGKTEDGRKVKVYRLVTAG